MLKSSYIISCNWGRTRPLKIRTLEPPSRTYQAGKEILGFPWKSRATYLQIGEVADFSPASEWASRLSQALDSSNQTPGEE